jgi:hypothetical protein
MEQSQSLIPARRTDSLVIQEVEGETLVYDLRNDKAHCLNRTAALVWKQCDGNQTVSEVAERVEMLLGMPVSNEVVWLALEQLGKRGLLTETVKKHSYGSRRMSRRELARRLGIATALMLPFIASINAPAAIQAASCGGIEAFCGGANPPCCSGLVCCDGSCLEGCFR